MDLESAFWRLWITLIILFTFNWMLWKCSSKFSFLSSEIWRCFREPISATGILLKFKEGWDILKFFLGSTTSWACLLILGLNKMFNWCVHVFIFRKTFNSFVVSVILWTVKNSDVSSANDLGLEWSPSEISFIQIKKRSGPRIDPSGTPATTSLQDEC